MNTLRQAAQEYLTMRRSLGYKLQEAGKRLLDFVTFMEQRRASYITQSLALAWAKQPLDVQPSEWACRLTCVRSFARHRSATESAYADSSRRVVTVSAQACATLHVLVRTDQRVAARRSEASR